MFQIIGLDDLFDNILASAKLNQGTYPMPKVGNGYSTQTVPYSYIPTIDKIPIKRVIYSGNATTVYFTDGTKTTVTCSSKDTYDRQTAIAYALVKRFFGKIGKTDKNGVYRANEIDGNGIGIKLEKIAASGFDQEAEKEKIKAYKATAKAEHEARQKAEAEAAWERKVKARAEEIRLERAAEALLDGKEPKNTCCCKNVLNEDIEGVVHAKPLPKKTPHTSGLVQIDPKDAWKLYRKPNKPFSEFTQAEKREYWRYQNAKRRASK